MSRLMDPATFFVLFVQGKVKIVADAVWSKLTGVFVNDVLHVQVSMHDTLNQQ